MMTTEPLTAVDRSVAVVIPFDARGDEHRARALDHVRELYAAEGWPVLVSEPPLLAVEWSKGDAVAELVEQTTADVLVIADADSFIADRTTISEAVRLVSWGQARWVIPHRMVYRLSEKGSAEVYAGRSPRLGKTVREPYVGPAGGGIVVVDRAAYDTVHGIDPRFLGWGGEDLSFGYALETLVADHARLEGPLVHLWHPHPAPDLRGSAESEALVADYREARGFPRRMVELVNRRPLPPPLELAEPIRFRLVNRSLLRLHDSRVIRFADGIHETADADLVDVLRRHPQVTEVRP